MNIDPSSIERRSLCYEIQLQGRISLRWLNWFEDMDLLKEKQRNTTASSVAIRVADQGALLGALQKLHNLGFQFESVRRIRELSNNKRSAKR
jgi:hypothetical protein